MSTTTDQPRPTIADLTTERPECTDPDYLAWKKAKIRKALEAASCHPDQLVSHAEMRKRFGLDR